MAYCKLIYTIYNEGERTLIEYLSFKFCVKDEKYQP